MYSDSTHFLYEILQNADDYGASEVCFTLSRNNLLVEHNGVPFTEDNVRAITYFGKSTSRDDLVKTGRFGVGFKSVFAFTSTPVIISGDEHFQIYGLYRVREYPYPDGFDHARTIIILQFDHNTEKPDYVEDLISPEEAYSRISSRLTGLNMNTLLFAKNIREIRWAVDGACGRYLREDGSTEEARCTTVTDGQTVIKYLVFARTPTWRGQQYKPVEIAFGVDTDGQLCAINDFLYVLFATTQETHLQFILNGPYRTTPSRETISEEDHFNRHLIQETCELVKEVLPHLRDMGLLTTQCLCILPNGNDSLREFYKPLLDVVTDTFHKTPLVPTDDGQYALAANVLQGPAALREVITKEEIRFFIGRAEACWAKGVHQNSRADHFLRGLHIERWGWEQLEEALDDKYGERGYIDDNDNAWLAARGDSWLQRLYVFLADAIKREECAEWTLHHCCIVRVLECGEETHVTGPKAYFPKGAGRSYKDLPQVKGTILQGRNQQATQKIHESLVVLGVSEIGEEERVDILLETFYSDGISEPTQKQHLKHMKTFIKWWKSEGSAKFEDHAIFRAVGDDDMHKPEDCFLDSPLRKTDLHVIYSKHGSDIPKKVKLWPGYSKLKSEEFCEFAVACGVPDRLVVQHGTCDTHPFWNEMRRGGWPTRRATINSDYYIPCLAALLKLRNMEVNLLIWSTVCKADPATLEAVYQPKRSHEPRKYKSSLVLELTEAEWIPDIEGQFRRACDVTKEQLHPAFKYDNRNGLLDEIRFGENAKHRSEKYQARNQAAKDMGFDSVDEADKWVEIARLAKEKGRTPDEFLSELRPTVAKPPTHKHMNGAGPGAEKKNDAARKDEPPVFPTSSVTDPEGRQERIREQLSESPQKKYEERKISVRTTRGAIDPSLWLREQYTNENGLMVCQICKKEMPFRKRDGQYYFEAVEAFSQDQFPLEYEAQFLALCPLCAAMYKELVKQDDAAMTDLVKVLLNMASLEVPLRLGDLEATIQFVETHFYDIKAILEEAGMSEGSLQEGRMGEEA
jgi:hypothetical protein